MKVLFMGTPDFAVPSLDAIVRAGHEVVGVVTQPDRARNRGIVSFCPVKQRALELGLAVFQYEKVRNEGADELGALGADVMVTCAYGQILDQRLLDLTPHGVLNVHASLLPAYRGSSPIQWAVINGEKVTGITVMKTALGVDTGDILLQKEVEILPEETAGELFDRLAVEGGKAIVEALALVESGKAVFTPQDESGASHFPMFTRESGRIDFSKSAKELVDFIRGTNPWPSAYCRLNGKIFKIWKARKLGDNEPSNRRYYAEGEMAAFFGKLCVACGKGEFLVLQEVQLEGGKRMSADDFMRGHGDLNGVMLEQ